MSEGPEPDERRRGITPRWLARKALSALRFPDRAMARLDFNEARGGELERLVHALTDDVAALRRDASELRRRLDATSGEAAARHHELLERLDRNAHHGATERAMLALQLADLDPPVTPPDGPLVTVVTASWKRPELLPTALDSIVAQTYPRWECIIVDDGSDDGTDAVVAAYIDDERFRYEVIAHQGAPAARNHALGLARGEIVAYLDSDNRWHRTHLARVVDAFEHDPGAVWALTGQVTVDDRTGVAALRHDVRSTTTLLDGNFADLNAIAHRRTVIDRIGAFDASLSRLSDWDLALRLAALSAPIRSVAATSTYVTSAPNRISTDVPVHVHAHAVRARHRGLPAADLRVLMAQWHYPQVTETYIASVVEGLRRLGAEVQVWSQDDVAVAYESSVPVLRGELSDAIAATSPHVVVTDWLHKGEELRAVTRSAGVPHVVRTHGFEHDPEIARRLLADPGVLVHTFPHLAPTIGGHPRLVVMPTCFDDERYRPTLAKDPRLVVRTAAGLLTKDLDTFLLAATLCPKHRFVLVLGHALDVEERTEVTMRRADQLGSPCELRIDLTHDEVAELVSAAGIYLHTHGTDHPVSMPMSIAESMATGCWVLGRDLPGMADYLGRGGDLYRGATAKERAAEAARLIQASEHWSRRRWEQRWERSSDAAYERFANRDVVEQMVRSWRSAFDLPSAL